MNNKISIMVKQIMSILSLLLFVVLFAKAKENIGVIPKKQVSYKVLADACDPSKGQIELKINNVRATLQVGGDFWWNFTNGMYIIPNVDPSTGATEVSSIFAGSIWVGGLDDGGQLKMAAQTYRQSGNDFWPGPLDESGASLGKDICNEFDQHYSVVVDDILKFRADVEVNGGNIAASEIPTSILNWPAKGNLNNQALATLANPFVDFAPYVEVGGSPNYDPTEGDYPYLGPGKSIDNPEAIGDQMIWWVYNDKGDIHTETGGEAIGLEVQALAFGFSTNNEINDMTFYKYKLLNKSTSRVNETYMGVWVDADLGGAFDDFVGCDTARDLGICYNGDAFDDNFGASKGYGNNPPIVGVDYFQGPKDTAGNILGMSAFLYYNNDFSPIGNPTQASHYYGYLSGFWKDGSPFVFGGNGHASGGGTLPFNFNYPSEPSSSGAGDWSECFPIPNPPADRRFIQSSGPFVLDPGAVNEIIIGNVWVRPNGMGGCGTSFEGIKLASDKAQALFNNNFKLVDGPSAPDMKIRELDQELIISLTYNKSSNNFGEKYNETDPLIASLASTIPEAVDSTYKFQGYQIYQLRDDKISASEYSDPDKARLLAQVDIKDQIDKIVNYDYKEDVQALVPTEMVDGTNNGIEHTFKVTQDLFAIEDPTLVNYKTYYFSVVAYAYNQYLPYDATRTDTNGLPMLGQEKPYLIGRKNIKPYSAIPHKIAPRKGGTMLNSAYGDGVEIIRLEGKGNGGNNLDITDATVNSIFASPAKNLTPNPVYKERKGPIDVFVFDPAKVPNANFKVYLLDSIAAVKGRLSNSAYWYIVNETTNDTVWSERNIARPNEQVIDQWGLVVNVSGTTEPGFLDNDDTANTIISDNNGLIEATIEYANPQIAWLSGLVDGNGIGSRSNWIRSGKFIEGGGSGENDDYQHPDGNSSIIKFYDPEEVYEKVLAGSYWAPYKLASFYTTVSGSPAVSVASNNSVAGSLNITLDTLASVDIVFTSDKSKWTNCPVVETGIDPVLSEGGKNYLEIRDGLGINPDGSTNIFLPGTSWFPGYAINVETGRRLNMMFGEDSWAVGENGNDMLWNPTSSIVDPQGTAFKVGGRHYIYIMHSTYDGGVANQTLLVTGNAFDKNMVYRDVMWVSVPTVAFGFTLNSLADGIIPTETKVRLRVRKKYQREIVGGENGGNPVYSFTTTGLGVDTNNMTIADSAMNLIKVVPNPYYAFSDYENNQTDNTVKFTNLPGEVTITIYSLDGTLLRQIKLDDNESQTYYDWDLKNTAGVKIASGMYLIHFSSPTLGERTLKWLGIMRQTDLDTF